MKDDFSSRHTISRPSVSFYDQLTLLFIGLKLGGIIDWSWWWVISPSLIGMILVFIVELCQEFRRQKIKRASKPEENP